MLSVPPRRRAQVPAGANQRSNHVIGNHANEQGKTITNTETPSRWGFLKTSTKAAGAAATIGGLSIARGAHAAGQETIKIALIGCGHRGTGACSQALSTKGPVKLVANADGYYPIAMPGVSKAW